jgi:hypothetical protein
MGQECARNRSRLRRLLAVLAVATGSLATFAVVSAAAWAVHARGSQTQPPTLSIDPGGPLGLSAPLPLLAAGDVAQRTATVRNSANTRIPAVALTIAESGGSALQRDALQLRVDRCSQPWASTPESTLRCPGTVQQLIVWQPSATNVTNRNVGAIPPGGAAWLRISIRLPETAPETTEGLAINLRYQFTS